MKFELPVNHFVSPEEKAGYEPSVRERFGQAAQTVDDKVIEELRRRDELVRSQLRKKVLKNPAATHYINTRGPDKRLYAVDGMILGSKSAELAKARSQKNVQIKDKVNTGSAQFVWGGRQHYVRVEGLLGEIHTNQAGHSSYEALNKADSTDSRVAAERLGKTTDLKA